MKDIDVTSRKQKPRWKEAGNAIVMLFAAVGMAGVVTYGLNNVMRGPGMMTAEVSRKTIAENNLVASSRLAINAATAAQANDGDCDGDGFVEPVPYRSAGGLPAPVGGGLIPMTIGASTSDPWGAQYGYCVWDAGTVKKSDAHAGCGGAGANRLDGGPKDNQPAIAVISAGKNGAFETSCNAYVDTTPADGKPDTSMVNRPAGSDDVVLSYTYAEANGIGGGEWKLKTADNTTAEVGKNLEIGGGGTFSGPVELTQKGLVLPGDPGDNTITGACTAAKDQQIRRNTSTTPPSLEICDFAGAGWTGISGGGGGGNGDGLFDPNAANCTVNEGGPLASAASLSIDDEGKRIWADGYYIYVAQWSGNVGVYTFNGTTLTKVTELDSPNPDAIGAVFGDGTYIYAASRTSGELEAWYFNGSVATLIDESSISTDTQDLWSDGTYIYVAGETNFQVFSFDGHDLTLLDTEAIPAVSVWGDGTYIYSAGNNFLNAYTFNGTALTLVGTTALGGDYGADIWGDDEYIYTALLTRIAAFSFNGTNFTQEGSNASVDAQSVWADGVNVFSSSDVAKYALTFDGSTFTVDSSVAIAYTDDHEIRGDGNFLYSVEGSVGSTSLVALSGYRCTEPPPRLNIPDPSYEEDPIGTSDYDPLDEGMIAHWPMNEGTGTTVEDVVGSYDGTFINTPIWNEGPDGDGSLSFDMDDQDAVQITGLMGSQPLGTIGMWANIGRSDIGVNPPRQSNLFSIADTVVIANRTDGSGLSAYLYQGGATWLALNSRFAVEGTGWHYITLTWDDTNNIWRLYIDGVEYAGSTTAMVLTYTGVGTNTFIGRHGNASTAYDYDGGIDDARMWNRALSPAEVAALYKRERKQSATRELSAISATDSYQGLLGRGEYSTCAIKADGTPWCWGNNASGQLGNGAATGSQASPVPVSIPTTRTYYLVSTNSDLSPASNIYTKKLLTEASVANTPNATALAAGVSNDGYGFTEPGIFGKDDGGGPRPYSVTMSYTSNAASACMRASVFAARVNSTGVVQGSEVRLGSPTFLTAGNSTFAGDADLGVFAATDRLRIRYNMQNTCAASQSPSINFDDDPKVVVPALEYPAWTQMTGYSDTMCGLRADGTAWCWGSDADGRLGNGTVLTDTPQSVPTPVINTAVRWSKISMGRDHGCGIKENGTLWCWGSDTEGQLGNGATAGAQATPVQVGAATDWMDISAGWTYTCGIRSGGFGYCWGDDVDLQLGNDAASADQISPVLVSGGDWAKIYAGYYTSYGIKTDGTLWAWGDDTDEQLGTAASSTDQGIPVQIQMPGPWVQVTGGLGYGCALKADSTVWCWGNFANNRLGYPATVDTAAPKMVIGSQGAVAVAGSSDSACLMKADRSVWCWGRDHLGQIGNGATTTTDTYLTAVTGFPGKPGWSWNDAATLITPPVGANISLPGNYLSPTTNNDGLGFVSSGRANLRSVADPGQLLVETTAASASSQMSFVNDPNATPPADYLTGIAARWEFNDTPGSTTAADSSGNANTFTLGSGASTRPAWTTGAIDGALDFDGSDDFLTRVNSASLNINTTVTLMAWVKFDTINPDFSTIIGKLNTNMANAQYRMGVTAAGRLLFDFCSAASAACSTYNAGQADTPNLVAGQWYHFATTFNNTTNTAELYVNGEQQGWTSAGGDIDNGNMRTTTQPLYSGYGIDGDAYFDGQIDEIRIYNAELTPAQIAGIYAATMGSADAPKAYTMGVDYGTNNFEIGRDVLAATNYLNAIDPDIAITQAGRVGVGTATPGAKMEVAGGVKFGAESYCAAGRDGAIRYVAGSYEYCDGTAWQPLGGGASGGADCTGLGDASINDPSTGHCYFIVNYNELWADAQTNCQAAGGYLAVPSSSAENTFVTNFLLSSGFNWFWIGLDDTAVEGDWKYSGGEKAGVSFWSGGVGGSPVGGEYNSWNTGNDPNGSGDCAHMDDSGAWIDDDCSGGRGYICEITGTIGGGSNAPGPTAGLIHHWKLDETSGTSVVDTGSEAGTGDFTGTWNGNPTPATITSDTGQDGTSYLFDDDYIDGIDPINFSNGDSITISLWNRMTETDYGDSRNFIMDETGGGMTSSGWGLALWNDDLNFVYKDTGGTWRDYVTTSPVYQNGVWRHYAVTYTFGTGASMQMYVDGQPVAGGWVGGATGNNPPQMGGVGTWMSGRDDGPWTGFLQGNMDDVRIYDRALSAAEIEQIYACTGGTGTCNVVADCTGLGDEHLNDPLTGQCYFKVTSASLAHPDAETACMADGAYLAIPNSSTENALLAAQWPGNNQWMGLDDADVEGDWAHTSGPDEGLVIWDGAPVGGAYNNWDAGEPNNGGGSEDCMSLDGGAWNDLDCSFNMDYICEKDANSSGGGGGATAPWKTTRLPSFHQTASAGWGATFGISTNGTAWAWGPGWDGVLGNNDVGTQQNTPIAVHSDSSSTGWEDWVSISPLIYANANCGLRANGTAWCWGDAFAGNLGDGDYSTDHARPVQVLNDTYGPGYTDWIQIGGTCGVRANGRGYCWGENSAGQNAVNDTTDNEVPDEVDGGFTDWLMMSAAGPNVNCGLRANGTLWCWGNGATAGGRLGDGSTNSVSTTVVQVHDTDGAATAPTYFTDWIYVSTGNNHACGIRANHTLYCWGLGTNCALGDNTCTNRARPYLVQGGYTDWVSVSAGVIHTCGIRANGTAWCWGQGDLGRLGVGNDSDSGVPEQVMDTAGTGYWNDWVNVSVGDEHACGTRVNGEMYCWGKAFDGSLGITSPAPGSSFNTPQLVVR